MGPWVLSCSGAQQPVLIWGHWGDSTPPLVLWELWAERLSVHGGQAEVPAGAQSRRAGAEL